MDIPNAAAPGSGPTMRSTSSPRDGIVVEAPGFERLAGKRQLVNQCSLTVYRLIGGDAIVGTNNTPVSGGPNET